MTDELVFALPCDLVLVKPTYCMVAETARPQELLDDTPAVLFTGYMDNLAFCNVPAHLHTTILYFVALLQGILYQVPFIWELEGRFLNCGECIVMCTPKTLSLTLKGIPPVSPFFDSQIVH